MYIVDYIDAGTKLFFKKIINEEIIADKGYCGKSFDNRSIKQIKMKKSVYNSIINSSTASIIKQGSSNFYIHCLSELNKLKYGCKPEKKVKSSNIAII